MCQTGTLPLLVLTQIIHLTLASNLWALRPFRDQSKTTIPTQRMWILSDLSSFAGKLLADKIEGETNVKINGTLGDQVKENSQSETDTNSGADGNPENIRVEWLAALTAAEEALKIKESQKMEHNTSSYEKVPLTSAMGEEKKTIQPLPTKEQKRAESVAPLQPNPTSTAESLSANDILAATSRQTEPEDLNHTHLNVVQGANKVQPAKVQPEQVDKDRQQQQQQQKETQQQRSKEKAIVVKDKPVGTSPSQDSHSGNKILSQSTDREHAEDRKKITNLQIQKMKDQQKTMDQKRIIKSEEAKEQRQKKEARDTVQSLVSEADGALKNANALIKKSKQANQKAQDAIEEVKSRPAKTELDQKENNGPELSQLINEAKISDQKAKVAQEKYNDLRKVADTAVEKYIAKFK